MRIHNTVLYLLLAGGLAAQTRDPLPVPDLPGYHTLKCDFHMHTVFSDGEVWPETRVSEAWRDGLDAMSLTDHSGYNPHKPDVSADLRRPYALAEPLARRLGIILIPGVEVAEGLLHCNALFITDPNAFEGKKLHEALCEARRQQAYVFWNHPGWKQTPQWFPAIAAAYDEKLLQGMEIVNELTFYPEAYPWIAEKQLTIMADSDVHSPIPAQYRPRTRPVTLVFARTADSPGVREALFSRRTAAWMGGEVWGAEEHLRGIWQGAVSLDREQFHFTKENRAATLQIRNRSAIPFRLRIAGAPAWLSVGAGEIPAEGVAAIDLYLADSAPAGQQSVNLALEITNLHVAPGRNLTIQLPLGVEIAR